MDQGFIFLKKRRMRETNAQKKKVNAQIMDKLVLDSKLKPTMQARHFSFFLLSAAITKILARRPTRKFHSFGDSGPADMWA